MKGKKYTLDTFIEACIKIHNDEFDYFYVKFNNVKDKIDIICKRCERIFSQRADSHLNGAKCNICSNIGISIDLTNDVIDNKLLTLNKTFIRIGNYVNFYQNMEWRCLLCNKTFINSTYCVLDKTVKNNCRNCQITRKLTNEDIDLRLKNRNIKIIRIENYKGAHIKIKWKCFEENCQKEFKDSPTHQLSKNRAGCTYCSKSLGEKAVSKILENNLINYTAQFKVYLNDSNKPKKIDFYIEKYRLFIEYNGRQHYEENAFSLNIENFKKIVKRDNAIKQYCIDNKINFLEIDARKFNLNINGKYSINKNLLEEYIISFIKNNLVYL